MRLLLGIATLSLTAAAQDYFPLHVGNQWIYRTGGTASGTVLALDIPRSADFKGNRYYLLRGLPQKDYWLRTDDDGRLLAYDPDQDKESVWYAFRAPMGEVYETALPYCCGRAMIRTRSAGYRGPVGELENLLEITYPGVFQVGLERELFLPYVGMIYRGQNTGGPTFASYDLIYARTGGVTVVAAPEVSFSLTLDKSVYWLNLMPPFDPRNPTLFLTARLTLRATHEPPLVLTFPSGQSFDLELRNEKGDVVYRWSEGKAFTLAIRTVIFGAETNWPVLVRLVGKDDRPLPEGKYVAEGWLTTMGPRAYSASVGFEIRHAQ